MRAGYDLAGQKTAETNALGVVTRFGEYFDGGYHFKAVTNAFGTANQSTRLEQFLQDGSLERITGTAVHPQRPA